MIYVSINVAIITLWFFIILFLFISVMIITGLMAHRLTWRFIKYHAEKWTREELLKAEVERDFWYEEYNRLLVINRTMTNAVEVASKDAFRQQEFAQAQFRGLSDAAFLGAENNKSISIPKEVFKNAIESSNEKALKIKK